MFFDLSQAWIDVEVMFGDDIVGKVFGHGTFIFSRESMSPMTLRNALFVPRMKKNLISVSMIKDRGLGVSFLDGHVRVFPKTARPSAFYTMELDVGNCTSSCFSVSMR